MHLSRIEGLPGTTPAVPGDDVVAAVAAVTNATDAGTPGAAAVATPVQGSFNPGVSRMLTHWKEN